MVNVCNEMYVKFACTHVLLLLSVRGGARV